MRIVHNSIGSIGEPLQPLGVPLVTLEASFENWRYWSEMRNGFWPLPAWARFALSLGASVARFPDDLGPSLTAVTVPTRGFSAALATAGLTLELNRIESYETTAEHLKFLRALEPGRTVWCDYTHKRVDGLFCGFVFDGGEEYVQLQTRRGNSPSYTKIPVRDAHRIQLAPKDRGAKRSQVVDRLPLSEFALAAFAAEALVEPRVGSRLDAVIVGQKNFLASELTGTEFSILGDEGHQKGFLQEVVRVADLGSGLQVHTFGAAVETPYDLVTEDLGKPKAVVFDGDRALVRTRSRKALVPHWIIFLDRTSRGFADGCDLIDGFYLGRRGLIDSKLLPAPPPGLELIGVRRGGWA